MGIVAMQLDKVRAARSLSTDGRLAALLHVTRQTISQWRSGATYPEEGRIAQLAELADEDPGAWLAQVREERATDPEVRDAWRSVWERLSSVAALVLLTVAGVIAPSSVTAGTERGYEIGTPYTLCALAAAAARILRALWAHVEPGRWIYRRPAAPMAV